jgi:mRNA-degrading endonuclease RelE of RelBE toxin-antitoxin system
MQFSIADTFTDSLARLTAEEQKAIKTTVFDLQVNPAQPGMQLHRIDKARDPNFWSVRGGRDLRLIVHKSESNLVLCYVDHHDRAYHWAERRRLVVHPTTGAAQLIEVRETVQEVIVPVYVEAEEPAPALPALFDDYEDEQLLQYGVPPEWLDDVKQADEESLLLLTDHLPSEASEALLELATGGSPPAPTLAPVGADPFAHPDAQRRFRVMQDVEELERALDSPWEKWTVFLHPAQRELVECDFGGPARVSGSAGTGKTIVALHRAVFLARTNPAARVLLTTFSDALANALQARLDSLARNEPRVAERIEIDSVGAVADRLYRAQVGAPHIASQRTIEGLLNEAAEAIGESRFKSHFLLSEWEQVVDAWQLDSWDAYRSVRRLGRKTGLPEQRREVLWSIFEIVRRRLLEDGLVTQSSMFGELTARLAENAAPPYDFVVVDEAQDMGVAELRFFGALAVKRRNGLFFAGDLGQRIFQQPFSWLALGVDIRGRSSTLRVNYRTSHQIRQAADRLLDPELTDADGNVESRAGTVSVFNGPQPTLRVLDDLESEAQSVASWLCDLVDEGLAPEEVGIFVRSGKELDRAKLAAKTADLPTIVLDEKVATKTGHISVGTMHLAKGLEFRAVAVMACDDEVLPSQARIQAIADEADLEDVYNTERHLLYVACTRARDHLLVTGVLPASEFLDDLN